MFDGIVSLGDHYVVKTQLTRMADRAFTQGDRAACVEAIENLYSLFDGGKAHPRPTLN